jgi:hypothetical protein
MQGKLNSSIELLGELTRKQLTEVCAALDKDVAKAIQAFIHASDVENEEQESEVIVYLVSLHERSMHESVTWSYIHQH